jgi:asparagine synthase (glutamine-hydrolysing)
MSAISGVFYLDGCPADVASIRKMTDSLSHRGRDGTGTWVGHSVALGHQMRHVTPESVGEKQPLVANDSDLAITADARIDNREDLIRVLRMRGRPGTPIRDSEIILAAYTRWGEACPDHLIGDFAFAIWDGRRQSVFCARDPMGVKPFYYFRSDRMFAFASEIKALLTLPDVPRHLNELQIACHLTLSTGDREMTFYRDVFRLAAASSLCVGKDFVRLERYWRLDPEREIRFSTNEDYAEAFAEIFRESVRARLRSVFPVGSTLSGGLDSSSIACTARDLLRSEGRAPLHTFSAVFPSAYAPDLDRIDERAYVDAVVGMGGIEPHFVRADEVTPLAEYDRVLWHMDEPPLAPNLYMHWALYGSAKESGTRVLLDGVDGDSAVSHGFGRLPDLLRHGAWDVFASEVKAISERHGVPVRHVVNLYGLSYLDELGRSGRWRTWGFTARQFAQRFGMSWKMLIARHGIRHLGMMAWSRRLRTEPLTGYVEPAFARAAGLHAWNAKTGTDALPQADARHEHRSSLEAPIWQTVLEVADRAAAAFGIEPRYPFFDRRLMEFCLALPAEQKLANGWSRLVLRNAMAGALPDAIRWRASKGDLSSNFYRGFLEGDSDRIREVLVDRPQPIMRYVDVAGARTGYEEVLDGADRKRIPSVGIPLFPVVTLGLWLSRPAEFGESVPLPFSKTHPYDPYRKAHPV